jgi:hypothetical protein
MWKANGKTTTLQLYLDSLSPNTEKLSLEGTMDLSRDRLIPEGIYVKHIIEGKILGTIRRGRRRMQLLDDLKETRRYWKLKDEAQDRTLWRTQFGTGYGPVARETNT